ncbi:hypothetical protein VK90_25870 [Bacillus sp. LK2]|nr:hypothetical protein VK90_25870 [Bacillus sp. LK2]
MIKLFSNWFLFLYRKLWVWEVFLIKLYFKATTEQGDIMNQTFNKADTLIPFKNGYDCLEIP